MKQLGLCDVASHYRWTHPADGVSRSFPPYWCPATCGSCKGDDPQWRTLKPLGNPANPSINPTVFSVGGVKIAIYKSASVFTAFIKGTQSPDLHAGPHYHVKAHNTHQYSRAAADVVLPTIKPPAGQAQAWCYGPIARNDNPKITYVRRTPRLGLRVEAKGDLELRLENTGQGWTPTYWAAASQEGPNSKNQAQYNPSKLPAHANAVTASIVVECSKTATNDTVKATFTLRDKTGKQLSATTLAYVRQAGTFFNPGPSSLVPKMRFARYIGYLAPNFLFDAADQCEMAGARFQNLKLYNQTSKAWLPWEWSRIEYAWSSQPFNLPTLDISSSTAAKRDTDICSCKSMVYYGA